jgi:two-component system, cell cycle sensor histidine kinase and response regulator CckA
MNIKSVAGIQTRNLVGYQQLVETSPNPIFSVNAEGVICTWNHACRRVFQHGMEIIGSHYDILFQPGDRQAMAAKVAQVFQRQALNEVELTFISKDGIPRVTLSRLYPMFDDENNVSLCIFANTDITERIKKEETFRRQLEELRVLHAVAVAGAESTGENDLIERATEIIGETFFPDNFGLLLLDESIEGLRHHPAYRNRAREINPLIIPLGQGITGRVALEGKPLRIPDVSKYSGYLKVDELTRSELCVPMKVADKVLGVINTESVEQDAFTEADERLLVTLAGQLASAIERLRVEASGRHRADQLAILYQASQEIAASLEPSEVYLAIHRAAAKLMHVDDFLIGLYDGTADRMTPVYSVNRNPDSYKAPNALCRELGERVIDRGQALKLGDVLAQAEDSTLEMSASVLVVPMRLGGAITGMLLCQCSQPNAYSGEDAQTLSTLANLAANAIENARLYDETQRRLLEITLLSKIISMTATEKDLPSGLKKICIELAQYYQAPEVIFTLFTSQLSTAQVIAEFMGEGRTSRLGEHIPVAGNPSIAYILERQAPLPIAQVQGDPRLVPMQSLLHRRGISSMLIAPVILGSEVIGTLEIADRDYRDFSSVEIALIEKVASQVSQVLERLGLFAATSESAELLARLASLGEVLNRPLSVSQVIEGIGLGAMELCRASKAVIYRSNGAGKFSAVWSRGLTSAYLNRMVGENEFLPTDHFFNRKEPLLVIDLNLLPETSFLRSLGEMEGCRSAGIWPMVYEDRVVAVITCHHSEVHPWSEAEQEVMQAFAGQAAVALENARLFEETRRSAAFTEALNTILTTVSAAVDLGELLEIAMDHTLKALGVPLGCIWALGAGESRGLPFDIIETLLSDSQEESPEEDFTCVVEDIEMLIGDDDSVSTYQQLLAAGIRALLLIPILANGKGIGGFCVASSNPRKWLKEDVSLLEGVGWQLGSAVERNQLLVKIKDNARQLQEIMETVPDGVLLLDPQKQVVLANLAAMDYLEGFAGDAEGEKLANLLSESNDAIFSPANYGTWQEITVCHPKHKIFEVAVQPLKGDERQEGWVLVLHDVTQERENQTRIQMQERMATVGQLAAGIAHDFNNIMAAIVVYADLLKRERNLSPSSHDRVVIIQQQVQRATSLIRQILDFSRRSIMEPSILDMVPFLKELEKMLKRILPETIHVGFHYQPGSYLVNADPTRLQQVFMNLAVNARDEMSNGGKLQLVMEMIDQSMDGISANPAFSAGEWVKVVVIDNGGGIAPENLPHIFEPFFTTKPVGIGTGLGLAQAYGVIKQHEGHIEVESVLGQGTTFTIYLPALTTEPATIVTEELPMVKGSGEMVLVVEDDPAAREAMEILLKVDNYQVLTASNGIEAFNIYEKFSDQISLVVSDVVMPEMGGVSLYHSLRKCWPDVKMLFVTGHPLQGEDQALLQSGKVLWLQKPYSVQSFCEIVQNLVRERVEGKIS